MAWELSQRDGSRKSSGSFWSAAAPCGSAATSLARPAECSRQCSPKRSITCSTLSGVSLEASDMRCPLINATSGGPTSAGPICSSSSRPLRLAASSAAARACGNITALNARLAQPKKATTRSVPRKRRLSYSFFQFIRLSSEEARNDVGADVADQAQDVAALILRDLVASDAVVDGHLVSLGSDDHVR